MTRVLVGYSKTRLPVLLLMASVAGSPLAASAQTAGTETLAVSGRAVAEAVQALSSRYGYVITYEDPRYAFEGDLEDVTARVRRDLDKYAPGKAPKVIVPATGTLTINIPTATSLDVQGMNAVLKRVVDAQAASNTGGHFAIERDGVVFHVVPTEVRNQQGSWASQSSIRPIAG